MVGTKECDAPMWESVQGASDGVGTFDSAPFSVSNDDLVHFEIDALNAKSEALHGPKPAAEQELRHEFLRIGHSADDFHAFGPGQDRGQSGGLFGADGRDGAEFDVEDFAVQEKQDIECLVLGGDHNASFGCQMGKERFYFRRARVLRMLFVVVQECSG